MRTRMKTHQGLIVFTGGNQLTRDARQIIELSDWHLSPLLRL